MTKKQASLDYTHDFELFWKDYPRRWSRDRGEYVKRKKWPAFLVWQALSDNIKAKCLRVVKQILKHEGTPRDAVTWLNQRGWDDIEEADKGHHLPSSMTAHIGKPVLDGVNINNERNRQLRALKEKP